MSSPDQDPRQNLTGQAEAMALGAAIADYEVRGPTFHDDPRAQRIDFPYLGLWHFYDTTLPESERLPDQIAWVGFANRKATDRFRKHPGSRSFTEGGRGGEGGYITKIDAYYNPSYGEVEPVVIPDTETLQTLLAETGFTRDPTLSGFITTALQTIAIGHLSLRTSMLAGDKQLAKAYCSVDRREMLLRQLVEGGGILCEHVAAKVIASLDGHLPNEETMPDMARLTTTTNMVAELFRLPHDSHRDVQQLIPQFMSWGWAFNQLKRFGIRREAAQSEDAALAWAQRVDDKVEDVGERIRAAINAEHQEYAQGNPLYYPVPPKRS